MADEKRLQLVIDPSRAKSGAKVAKDAVLSVEAAADKATKALAKLERAILSGSSPLDKLNKAIGHVVNVNQKMLKSINDLSAKLDGVNTSVRNGAQGLTNWEKSLERAKDKTAMLNSELGRQLVAEKQLHAELTKQIKVGSDRINQLSAQEMAQKKLADSVAFWTQRTKDLNSEEYKSLVQMREKARQLEAYEKSMVDGLSTTQKAAKAENELRKAIERGKIELDQYENGLAQKNIEMQESIAIQRRLAQSEARLKATMDGTYDTIIKNEAAIRKYKRELLGLEDANNRLNRSNRDLSQGFTALGGALGTITGAYAVTEVIRLADAYKAVGNRVAVVTGTTEGLSESIAALFKVSVKSRTELDATVDVYAKMTRANEQLGYSQQEVLRITETVSKAVAMSGASVQGAQGALLQFAQAISGNFQASAQELNSIIEQAPALGAAMADALNTVNPELNATIGNLKALAKEGKITSADLLQGFLNISDEIDGRFSASTELVAERWRNVVDAVTIYIGETDKALGITSRISAVLKDFSLNIKQYADEIDAALLGIGAALGVVTIALGAFIVSIAAIPLLIAGVVGGAVGSIYYFRDEISNTLKEIELAFYETLLQDIPAVFSDAGSALIEGFASYFEYGAQPIESLLDLVFKAVDKIADAFEGSILQSALTTFGMRFQLVGKQIQLFFAEVWSNILSGLESMINSAVWMLNKFIQETIYKLNQIRDFIGKDALVVDAITPVIFSSDAKKNVEDLRGEIERLSGDINTQADVTQRLIDEEKEDLQLKKDIAEWASFAGDATITFSNSNNVLSDSLGGSNKELEKLKDAFIELEDEALSPVEKQQKELAKIWNTLVKGGKLLGRSTDEINKIFVKHAMEISGANDRLEELRDTYKEITYQMNPALEIQEKMIEAERAFNQAVADGSANLADKEQWLDRYRRSIDGTDDRLQTLQNTIADTFMDGFEAAMEGGDAFKDWFENLLKELALMAIRNQIVIPIVVQFLGVNGGTAGMVQQGMSVLGGGGNNTQGTSGGIPGVVSNIGSLFGGNSMGIMISDVGGWIGGSSPIAGTGAGNYISGASANAANLANWQIAGGGMLGGVLSGALGLSGEYSAITGAAGTALGSSLLTPVLGPLAPLAGSFLGSSLGGLIGNSKPSNKQGRATYDLLTNEVMIGGQTGDKFSQENRDAAELLAGAIARDVVGTISSLSGEELSGQLMVGVGNRDPLAFWYGTAGETDTEPQNVVIGSAYYANQGSIGVANTRDPEEFINSITEAFAELTDLDLTVYKDLADENELLIDSIKRVELQFSFVRGLFEDVGDSTEVTKEFADTWTDEFIKPILDSGESLSEGLTRLVQQYSVVQSYTELFGQSLGNTAQGILVATDNIVKAAGGLDQFNAAASSYYQNFYSEEERFEHFADNLTNVFKDLGLELPTTTQGFRDLVEGLDLTKEADQELYTTLLNLNPQVKEYIDGLDSVGEALSDMAMVIAPFRTDADNALQAVKDSVDKQKGLLKDRYDTEKEALETALADAQAAYDAQADVFAQHQSYIDDLSKSLDLLRRVYKDMTMDTFAANRMRRENAQALIRSAVSAGVTPSYDTLEPALSTLQQPSEQYFSSFEDYARDFYVTKELIGNLGDITDETLTAEERMLDQMRDAAMQDIIFYQNLLENLDGWYERQLEKLDAQLASAQAEYDLVMQTKDALSEGFDSVAEAINTLSNSLASFATLGRQQTAQNVSYGTSNGVTTVNVLDDPISEAYQKVLGRDADIGGYQWWANQLQSGAIAESQLEAEMKKSAEYLSLPAFADGGIHTGGWRLVGEQGPELEYTPPSRIYSNSDTSDMFDMSELVVEVKQLREDMRSANYAIAKNTQKTAKTLEKFDYDGLPEQRTV
jgi:tape measure domain-containing protein